MFIEFKRPGEQLRPLQAEVLCQLRQLDHTAEMVDSKQQFLILLRALLQKPGSLLNIKPEV